MRIGLSLVLATALAACGSDSGGPGGGDDGGGDDGTTTPDGGDITPPKRGFQLTSPDIDIPGGTEITYCWYFRTPNTETMAIKRWQSHMTPGSHHVIMFLTGNKDEQPPGTVSDSNCGGAGLSATWTYAAQTEEADLQLPEDDGAGKPLGQEIAASTGGYLQMHYLNAKDVPIKVHVTLNAEAHEANVEYTKTAAFVSYNSSISIPKNAGIGGNPPKVETASCAPPANSKFWMMSTHAHRHATNTAVKDGTSMVFTSDDWEHPGAKQFAAPTFYTFTNRVTYECTYKDTGDNGTYPIQAGPSAVTDEMCMASGYYFPAPNGPKFCLNSFP